MRIVIDFQGAQTPGSRDRGIGRYSRSITRSIIENAGDHEVLLALNGSFGASVDAIRTEFGDILPKENFRVWRPTPAVAQLGTDNNALRKAAQFYREVFLGSLNPDIVHVSSLFEGLSDDAVVSIGGTSRRHFTSVSLYDLIPHIHRETYLPNPATAAWYDQRIADLRRADLLLGISQSSCNEAIDYLGVDPDRVVAVGTASDPQFHVRTVGSERQKQLSKRYGLKGQFIMYTGGIDYRKNIERLIEAFGRLPATLRRKHQLAIVCSIHEDEKQRLFGLARSAGLSANALVLTGYVPEDDLIDLYNTCHLFVFPSWHEGFGLPALEAMSCGAPTIASNRSSLPEVIGRADALFDPFDTDAIATSMQRVLEDDAQRQRLVEHAASQSARFSWGEIGRRAVESFEQLASKRKSHPTIVAQRPRLAFCSPLPPTQSGIADVSKEVIPHLAEHYRIDAVVHDDELERIVDPIVRGHSERVIGHSQFLRDCPSYDRIVYNLGNSGFHVWMFDALEQAPGAVILHDFFLSAAVRHGHFLKNNMNAWAQQLYLNHGPTPLYRYAQPGQPETVVRDYPCSVSILENALGVIVHSDHAKKLASEWFDTFEVERWRRAPLPRDKASLGSRQSSRDKLGFSNDDFIVSSFGILNSFKHSDRIVRAFANSRLAEHANAKLLFVGGSSPEHRHELLELAASVGVKDKVAITGWTSAEDYGRYLAAVDVAVQLRRDSRGETSAAVLDCLSRGVPTIVNGNGAMAELAPEVAMMLSDEFEDRELVDALNKLQADDGFRSALGERGRSYADANHAPRVVAQSYFEAIEGIYADPKQAILENAVGLGSLESGDAARLARSIGEVFDVAKSGTIYLDVSVLAIHDAKSGIQRVVRNILSWLVKDADPSCRIEPIYFDQQTGRFVRAAMFSARFFNTSFELSSDPFVAFAPGDTYVALDLAHHHAFQAESVLAEERQRGVTICFVVYDLLPIHFPELFPDGVPDLHSRWLEVVARADRAICISRAVADELVAELGRRERPSDRSLEITWFHLGADVDEIHTHPEAEADEVQLPERTGQPTFIAVGTIEPRKGHREVLEAFEHLWTAEIDCRLILVGARGWKMDDFLDALQDHKEWSKRLFWFERLSDKALKQLYEMSDCLIAASLAEGFGLPIVEAHLHDKPVIARDIPVFREVAQPGTMYFGGTAKVTLAEAVRRWLEEPRRAVDRLAVLNWRESATQFREALLGRRPYAVIGESVAYDRTGDSREPGHRTAQTRNPEQSDSIAGHPISTSLSPHEGRISRQLGAS